MKISLSYHQVFTRCQQSAENSTRVQWLAFCQPRNRILGQHWVLKSVNSVLLPIFAKMLFTDLCGEMCWVYVLK